METRFRSVFLACALSIATLNTGCLGEMALFNKLQDWNASLGDRWVNSLIHFAMWIGPYELAIIGDLLVINTIEFWSGENPVSGGSTADAASAQMIVETHGKDQVVIRVRGEQGEYYAIHARRGEPAQVYRDGALVGQGNPEDDGSWVFHDLEGQQTRVATPGELAAAFPHR